MKPEHIQKLKREAGQPVGLTEEDKAANKILKKLFDNACERCGRLKEIDGKPLCAICKALEEDNKTFQRETTKERLKVNIENLKDEIAFKKEQVDNGEVKETRTISYGPDGKPTIIDGYVDGVKPAFILKNEIRQHNAQIKSYESQLNLIKKDEEKDEDTNIKAGDQGKA